MTVKDLLLEAIPLLIDAGVADAPRDARVLLAHCLRVDRSRITLVLDDDVDRRSERWFRELIDRRTRREPVSHITGRHPFYGRDFVVTPEVLAPRPESETLIEAALSEPFEQVLDLGVGSGCLLLTLLAERPGSSGLGIDLSLGACAVARRNAYLLGLRDRVRMRSGDWASNVRGAFDLIVANPPYIAASEMPKLDPEVRLHEPRLALTDDADGLSAYRAIIRQVPWLMTPGGRLMVEIGPTQGDAVAQMMCAAGLSAVTVLPDLDGRDRVVQARRAQR